MQNYSVQVCNDETDSVQMAGVVDDIVCAVAECDDQDRPDEPTEGSVDEGAL